MKNENYIQIQGWMINELNLKGNELMLYAVIYGFSQDGQSKYFGSQRYIAKALKISLPTVNHLITKLLEKKLIKLSEESHYQAVLSVKESLTHKKEVLKKVKHQCLRKLNSSVKESLTNNIYTNNKNNNTNSSEQSSQPFNFENILEKMEKSNNILNVIIATYWRYKSSDFIPPKTKEQYQSVLTRELRMAKSLKPYTIEEIKKTMYDLNSSGLEWSLKAVINWIDKDRTKIINIK